MTTPRRVQLSRAAGARLPAGAINVARPTRWGNPFKVGSPASISGEHWGSNIGAYDANDLRWFDHELVGGLTDALTVALYADALAEELADGDEDGTLRAGLLELRGHDLACWCKPGEPCHADVLLRYANGPAL